MANGKHTDNGVDQRIVKFIGRHHVMTIASAATECGPYCANLFYAYIPERNLFVFTSDDRTRHYREMYLNGRVAATIVLETRTVGQVQGLQILGRAALAEGEVAGEARSLPAEISLRRRGRPHAVDDASDLHEIHRQPARFRQKTPVA